MQYLVCKYEPPDHVVRIDEAEAYWEEHLFIPLQVLADSIPGDANQLVILKKFQYGMAEVEASPTALALLIERGYTVKAI